MTEQEINVAIAEACGWVRRDESYWDSKRVRRTTCIVWSDPNGKPQPLGDAAIPNYCTDLNAMHEAEKTLFEHPTAWNDYAHYVYKLACNLALVDFVNFEKRDSIVGYGLHCPASQRAEAFLRTLGKWRDEP